MTRRGFSLAEIILSLGLCALLILSVAGLFTQLLGASTKTGELSAGQIFAAQKLDDLIQNGTYDQVGHSSGAGSAYVTDASSKTNFYYQMTKSNLPANASSTARTYLGAYYLTVQVWWNTDSPTQCRPGTGLQTTQASRLIYPRVSVP